MLDLQSEIAKLLHADHMTTLATLQSLDELLASRPGRLPNLKDEAVRRTLQAVIDIAAHEVGRHFAFEEGQLFPLLEACGQTGMVGLLTMEHHSILPAAQEAARLATEALAAGTFTPDGWEDFQRVAMELLEREMFHIQKEEMGLLAAIAALVSPEDDARLAAAYRALA